MTRATLLGRINSARHNERVRLPVTTAALALTLAALSACGSDADPVAATPPTPSASGPAFPNDPADPRSKLAARAAAAKDLRQVAFYVLRSPGRPDRTVGVTTAADGSWRLDLPGGAHGGAVDIALVSLNGTLHQCVLPGTGCIPVDGALPRAADPRVHHVFSDWLSLLIDRQQALAVSLAQPLDGAAGDCFAIESSAVSLQLPLDAGIYCYERDGTLTAARLSFGTMVLAGKPGAAPPTVTMPGPIVTGSLLLLAAPPSPSASVTPSP